MRLRISRQTEAPGDASDTLAFRRAAVAIVLLAIAVRLLFCGLAYPRIGPRLGWAGVDDGYDEIASSLLDGHGYVLRAGGPPVIDTPPGYAYLLAGLFAVTGTRTAEGWPLWTLQALLDATTTLLLALYARRLFGSPRIALLAAAAWALYPQIVVYSARPFSEIVFTLLLFALALATARLLRNGRASDGVLVGVLWGVSVLFKEKLIFLPLFLPAVLWKRQHRRGRGTLAPAVATVFAMALVVSPWLLRQHAVVGRWVPITERSGRAVHFGLKTDFSRSQVLTGVDDDTIPAGTSAGNGAGTEPSEAPEDQSLTTGLDQIASSPLDFAKHVALKLVVFWFWGQGRVMPVNAAVQLPLVALAILGTLLWRRRVDLTVPLLFIAYFLAIHALTTVRMRYSLPIMPFVIMLAAAAVDRLAWSRRAAVLAAGVAILVAMPLGARAADDPDSLIEAIAGEVHAAALRERVEELSGERAVTIGGVKDTLTDRYSPSAKCRRAETFVAERFAAAGFDVSFQSYFGTTLDALARGNGYLAAAGSGGNLLFSEDADHWVLRSPPGHGLDLHALLVRGDTLWAGGDAASVFRTVDAGRHWLSSGEGGLDPILGLEHAGGDTLWAVGDYGLLRRSVNGGLAWSDLPFPSPRRLTAVARAPGGKLFASALGAFFVGDADGMNWRTVPLGSSLRLNDVIFAPDGTGWIAGDAGTLFRSRDGGLSWRGVNAGTVEDLHGISFRDASHGMAGGSNGLVIVTGDGGDTWTPVPTGSHALLRAASDGVPALAGGIAALLVSAGGAFVPPVSIDGTWRNVVATLPGRDHGAPCLLSAHLDNILFPGYDRTRTYGADDNASGVAVLLEAAPLLARLRFERDIRLVAFTGEEEGLIGSAAYAASAEAHGDSIAGVFNLDMVAVNGDGIPAMDVDAGDDPGSLALAETFVDEAARVAPGLLPGIVTAGSTGESDHGSFWRRGYAAVLLFEDAIGTPGDPDDPGGDFNPRLHTPADRVDTFDPAFHEAIARSAIAAVAALARPLGANPLNGVLLTASPPSPNPGKSFSIAITLSASAPVTLEVFDVAGRRMRMMSWPALSRGAQTLTWDARDARERAVPAGVYFYRVRAGGRQATGRVVVAR